MVATNLPLKVPFDNFVGANRGHCYCINIVARWKPVKRAIGFHREIGLIDAA